MSSAISREVAPDISHWTNVRLKILEMSSSKISAGRSKTRLNPKVKCKILVFSQMSIANVHAISLEVAPDISHWTNVTLKILEMSSSKISAGRNKTRVKPKCPW
jgi:hypothetical protein